MDNINLNDWINKFQAKQKLVLYALGALVALAAGIYYVSQVYLPELETEAQDAMYMAQLNFEKQNFEKALNGEGKWKGFNYVKENYSFTKANKIAKLYAGICNLNLGKFDKAIEDLKGYSSDDPEMQSISYSALGDAYAEKNNMSEAISYYEKASKSTSNSVLAPRLALKAGKAYEVHKDLNKALEMFKYVKSEYPNSQEANMAEIYISKIENQLP